MLLHNVLNRFASKKILEMENLKAPAKNNIHF